MKPITKALLIFAAACSFSACQQHESTQTKQTEAKQIETKQPELSTLKSEPTVKPEPTVKIGIILPHEHTGLQEMVAGFTDQIHQSYSGPVEIKVLNAQGDVHLQRSMIKQLHDQHYSMIIPVTNGPTLMTTAMIRDIPIISLAANFSETDRQQLEPCNIAIVHDAIPPEKIVTLIHEAYPNIKQLALVHSNADNLPRQARLTFLRAEEKGIYIKSIQATTPDELAKVAQSLSAKTQGILVLKDHLIVNNINILAKIANERHIPLITSDQVSAQLAAGFALGVREREIGQEGATLAAAVLLGDAICHLANIEMKNQLIVFINPEALKQQAQDVTSITEAAKRLKYEVEMIGKS